MKEVLAGIRGVRNRNLAELAATALSGPRAWQLEVGAEVE